MLSLLCTSLWLAGGVAVPARFTETFASDPTDVSHSPFIWHMPAMTPGTATGWSLEGGALECRVQDGRIREARALMWDTGVNLTDDTNWSLETGFRHFAGAAPSPQYEAVIYVGWRAEVEGQYGLLALCYDAGKQQLILLNGGGQEAPIAVDLSDRFHALRLTVQDRQARVYVGRKLRLGPVPVRTLACESPSWFILGPITQGQTGTWRCRWDYLAFTDAGGFAPGEGGWEPRADREPVSALRPGAEEGVDPSLAFDHPPYPGIRLVTRHPGADRYYAAYPEEMRRWQAAWARKPEKIEVPEYRYTDGGPSTQNVYRFTFPLRLDERRCVAMQLLTRGIDDTIYGFMDYKLWYCLSTDGGMTWDTERPLIQQGAEYSAVHPTRYTWIGKNSFCFATLPPAMLRLSNSDILLPCYYAPLDERGEYQNPHGASTYSNVFCLIGRWNEARGDVDWDITDPIAVAPELSTGGLSECAVVELRDRPGHVFMAIRGGNEGDRTGQVPCWKWKTLSTDYGRTWSQPEPLTFSDGTPFWSPTSLSSFFRSSRTGKAYWIGNISRVRPRGGWPRYPLVVAELDEEKLGLKRETVTIIDDRGPEDGSDLQLSNWGLVEDAATGHLLIMLTRMGGAPGADGQVTYELELR